MLTAARTTQAPGWACSRIAPVTHAAPSKAICRSFLPSSTHRVAQPLRGARLAAPGARRQRSQRGALCVQAKGSNEVLVVGSSGQTASRIIYFLARKGFKVTAGVDTDIEESKQVLGFAKSLEILKEQELRSIQLAEFNPLDADSIASVLRRGQRVVLVVGDQAGSRRADVKVYATVLDALLESASRISQLVVVYPLGGGGGTAMFGRGSGGAAGARLSPVEQQVVQSGVDYLLVRAASSDRVTDSYGAEAPVVVAAQGRLPAGLQVSRAQVAAAVVEAMQSGVSNAVLEVGASPNADEVPLSQQIAEALAAAAGAEEEEEEVVAAPAKAAGGLSFFTIGGSKKKPAPVAEVEEEEEEAEEPAKPAFGRGFFTIGGSKRQPAPVEEEAEEEEEEEEEAAPAKPAFSFFGKKKPAAVVEEEEEEEDEEAAPAKPAFSFFGNKKPAAVAEEEEEEEEEAAPAKPTFSFFGKKKPAAVVEEEEEEAPAPKKAFAFGTQRIRSRGRAAVPEPEEEEDAPPKREGTGFFGTRSVKAPAPAPAEEEEAPQPKKPAFSFSLRPKRAAQQQLEEEEEAAPPPRRGFTLGGSRKRQQAAAAAEAPAPVPRRGRAAAAAVEEVPAPAKKKSGGLLGMLGIQQETVYADE